MPGVDSLPDLAPEQWGLLGAAETRLSDLIVEHHGDDYAIFDAIRDDIPGSPLETIASRLGPNGPEPETDEQALAVVMADMIRPAADFAELKRRVLLDGTEPSVEELDARWRAEARAWDAQMAEHVAIHWLSNRAVSERATQSTDDPVESEFTDGDGQVIQVEVKLARNLDVRDDPTKWSAENVGVSHITFDFGDGNSFFFDAAKPVICADGLDGYFAWHAPADMRNAYAINYLGLASLRERVETTLAEVVQQFKFAGVDSGQPQSIGDLRAWHEPADEGSSDLTGPFDSGNYA